MKKALGSVPKNLAWIDQESFPQEQPEQKSSCADHACSTNNSSKIGLQCGWTRATFIIKEEHCKKLKAHAYWERISVKEILDALLEDFFQGKKIRAIPPKNR